MSTRNPSDVEAERIAPLASPFHVGRIREMKSGEERRGDYAAAALPALIDKGYVEGLSLISSRQRIAEEAFKLANAMLAAEGGDA